MTPRRRRGTSVVEALVALLLGLMLVTLSLGIVARQRAVQVAMVQQMGFLDTARMLRHVVGTELRAGWSPIDATLHAPDSIALRAFRGFVRVCATVSWNSVLVSAEGARLPDATKDSLLFLTSGGRTWSAALVSVRGASDLACGARAERSLVLSVSDSIAPDVVLARFFETGSYHLSGGALRYRRGRSGRQPLTPESVRTPPSAFARGDGGGVEATLVPRRTSGRIRMISLDPRAP